MGGVDTRSILADRASSADDGKARIVDTEVVFAKALEFARGGLCVTARGSGAGPGFTDFSGRARNGRTRIVDTEAVFADLRWLAVLAAFDTGPVGRTADGVRRTGLRGARIGDAGGLHAKLALRTTIAEAGRSLALGLDANARRRAVAIDFAGEIPDTLAFLTGLTCGASDPKARIFDALIRKAQTTALARIAFAGVFDTQAVFAHLSGDTGRI